MIRPAFAPDVPALLAIERASFERPTRWDRDVFEFKIAHDLIHVLLVDEEIVGYCCWSLEEERGRLESLAVAPSRRHGKFGTQLVEKALSMMADGGARYCDLECEPALVGYYLRFGFQVCGFSRGVTSPGEDTVLMRRLFPKQKEGGEKDGSPQTPKEEGVLGG